MHLMVRKKWQQVHNADTQHYHRRGEQVVGIYELLENIILHLPLQDILLSQRVSTAWKGVVRQSMEIRQALLLEPVTGPKVYWDGSWRAEVHGSNGKDDFLARDPLLNPLLTKFLQRQRGDAEPEHTFVPLFDNSQQSGEDGREAAPLPSPEASLRRMLSVHPIPSPLATACSPTCTYPYLGQLSRYSLQYQRRSLATLSQKAA